MSFITAILLYIGVISSPTEVNDTIINANASKITYYSHDKGFLEWDARVNGRKGIVITDIMEGD